VNGAVIGTKRLCLEKGPRQARLADDGQQSADPEFVVQWHRHSYGRVASSLLHNGVAATLANEPEAIAFEDLAGRAAG
jgi:hypothetical protein